MQSPVLDAALFANDLHLGNGPFSSDLLAALMPDPEWGWDGMGGLAGLDPQAHFDAGMLDPARTQLQPEDGSLQVQRPSSGEAFIMIPADPVVSSPASPFALPSPGHDLLGDMSFGELLQDPLVPDGAQMGAAEPPPAQNPDQALAATVEAVQYREANPEEAGFALAARQAWKDLLNGAGLALTRQLLPPQMGWLVDSVDDKVPLVVRREPRTLPSAESVKEDLRRQVAELPRLAEQKALALIQLRMVRQGGLSADGAMSVRLLVRSGITDTAGIARTLGADAAWVTPHVQRFVQHGTAPLDSGAARSERALTAELNAVMALARTRAENELHSQLSVSFVEDGDLSPKGEVWVGILFQAGHRDLAHIAAAMGVAAHLIEPYLERLLEQAGASTAA